jgi:hypothetical protein
MSSQAHEFRFNQRELQALVNRAKNNTISVAVCGILEENGFRKFYLCAVANNAQNEMDTTISPIIACPFPPRWITEDALSFIPHSDIAASPKFFVSAPALGAALADNTPPPHPDGEKLVMVTLDAEIKNGVLESFVTFTMKDDKDSTVGNPLRAVADPAKAVPAGAAVRTAVGSPIPAGDPVKNLVTAAEELGD